MAIYRNVHLSFWEDTKVADDFTPEDKFFMLWLLTNPKTNLIGCYEISFKKAQLEIGYTKDSIEMLLKRMEEEHRVIKYDKETREVLLFNWHKYNWTASSKLDKPIIKSIEKIKSEEFRKILVNIYESSNRTIPYPYPMDTTDTDTDTVTDSITNSSLKEKKDRIPYQEIIDYLNFVKKGKKPYTLVDKTKKLIRARWKELSGKSRDEKLDYFRTAIDNSYFYWYQKGNLTPMRPSTLFNGDMESRYNGDSYNWSFQQKQDSRKWGDENRKHWEERDKEYKQEQEDTLKNKSLDDIANKFKNL